MIWDFFEGRVVTLSARSGRMPDITRALAFRDYMKRNLVDGLNRPKKDVPYSTAPAEQK